MEKYRLSKQLNEKIVDGIMDGYQEYIDVRREKARTMRISGAYAWVKGNHIDNQVAKACEDEAVDFKLSKAGVSWQYLQFKLAEEKVLFIIRNARYFNEQEVSKGRDIYGSTGKRALNYIENLMKINEGVEFGNLIEQPASLRKTLQLELFDILVDPEEVRAIKE